MADDPEAGDDIGWWDCSLCTYKNSADKFKCEICDLRRGTSTRKPRCNADTIVAQVVKQQEQIRQQTRAKPTTPKSGRTSTSGGNSNNSNNNHVPTTSSDPHTRTKKSHRASEARSLQDSNNDDDDDIEDLDSESEEQEPKPKQRKSLHKTKKKKGVNFYHSDSSDATDQLSPFSKSPKIRERSSSVSSDTTNYSSSNTSPEPTTSSSNNHDHSFNNTAKTDGIERPANKTIPIEIKGNLIKYVPPTSTGRTGLIIDKKRFTQHSVTVNDVTITFTEFATRQNKYIRKKKKRRDHSKSRPQTNTTDSNDNNNANSIDNANL